MKAFRAKFEHKLRVLREKFENKVKFMRENNRKEFSNAESRLDRLESAISQEIEDRVTETDDKIAETQDTLTRKYSHSAIVNHLCNCNVIIV